MSVIDPNEISRTIVLHTSIDSGSKTTKLMGRFIRKDGTQRTKDVILFGFAQGSDESFLELKSMLSNNFE